MKKFFTSIIFMIVVLSCTAQIYEPEGLNLPGTWNGWVNPPVNRLALASSTQVPGGMVKKITTGTPRWQTTLKVAASGGDTTGGTYAFIFSSGPASNPWSNAWKDVTVSMNTLQPYNYYTSGGTDNTVTVANGKWYTINWKDAGYANTEAIFMETSGAPVEILTVSQTPPASLVHFGQAVTINITLGSAPSPEEKFYVRYSTDNYSTSNLASVTITAATGSATIPALSDTVSYYVFSSTIENPSDNFDMYTIKLNNNEGPNYSFAYKTNATFKVDMSGQTVSSDGVHLTGDFQGWDSIATPMTLSGNGIYTVTVPINTGSYQEYKFLNGNTFAGGEIVPQACGTDNGVGGFNRFLTLPQADTILPVVCFSSCSACPTVVSVTFNVDMSFQTVSADGVHLAGTFQGWDPSATLMTNTVNNIYSKTVEIDAGVQIQYKFINGINWENEETVPEACGVPDGQNGYNRFITVPDTDTTLTTVCFSSCSICNVGTGSVMVPASFNIYPNPAADILDIVLNTNTAGSFSTELYNTNGEMAYSYRTEILKPGQTVVSLSLNQLPEGLYFFILRSGIDNTVVFSQKLIIR